MDERITLGNNNPTLVTLSGLLGLVLIFSKSFLQPALISTNNKAMI